MVVPLACTYCRQKTELGFSLAGDWELTAVWCVMLNPLAFNYNIQVQKIPEKGRGGGKESHFSINSVKVFSHLWFPVSWKMEQTHLATESLRCLWTVRSFFQKASSPLVLFLFIPISVYFLVCLSWVIFIFTFIFTWEHMHIDGLLKTGSRDA